jgi:hypothetical protein
MIGAAHGARPLIVRLVPIKLPIPARDSVDRNEYTRKYSSTGSVPRVAARYRTGQDTQ